MVWDLNLRFNVKCALTSGGIERTSNGLTASSPPYLLPQIRPPSQTTLLIKRPGAVPAYPQVADLTSLPAHGII